MSFGYDDSTIQGLVNNPAETLTVELKSWLDTVSDEHIAKIAKACLALRNNNGGFLVIGFDNKTCQPAQNQPANIRDLYHADKVQSIVSKYASVTFETEVKFVLREQQEFPVICVADGVRTPVASKADLKGKSGKFLIKEHAVYVRSLSSNGIASSTEATHRDWDRLVSICMENREADVGRFLRRHLVGADMTKLREFFQHLGLGVTQPMVPIESPASNVAQLVLSPQQPKTTDAQMLLDEGLARYEALRIERKLDIREHGAFEVAVVINGLFPIQSANQRFLNLVASANPQLTGWPFWVDSRAFRNDVGQPHVFNGRWESLLIVKGQEWFSNLDFWMLDPKGLFYHRRLLEDDAAVLNLPESPRHFSYPEPLTVFDIPLHVARVGETLATAQALARALEAPPANTTLRFCFRWTRLKGRQLSNWATRRHFISRGPAYQDTVVTQIELPAETAETALFQYVHTATQPLTEIFGGLELGLRVIEEVTARMLKREW